MREAMMAILVTSVLTATAAASDWPGWGGPSGDFRLKTTAIAADWPDTGPETLWRRALGPGYSAIVAGGGKLYTAYYRDGGEAVIALDPKTGETLWETHYETRISASQEQRFGTGPNASPLLTDGKLYVLSFDGQLHCLEAERGTKIWDKNLVAEMGAEILDFGAAAAPLRYRDMVMVLLGGKEGLVGFDLDSGEIAWRSEPVPVNYAIPTLIAPGGVEQFAIMAKKEVLGISAASGKKLWSHPVTNPYDVHCAGPLWGGNGLLFVVSQKGSGSRTLRLTAEGGEITVEKIAENNKFNVFQSNAIRVGNIVYGADQQILSAIDITSGEILWRERGFPRANLIKAGERWIIQTEDGELILAELSPEKLEVLSRVELLSKPSWTPPTLVGTVLYLRDKEIMLALDLS